MIEPNTDTLTLVFTALLVTLPITLHALFVEEEHERAGSDQSGGDGDEQ